VATIVCLLAAALAPIASIPTAQLALVEPDFDVGRAQGLAEVSANGRSPAKTGQTSSFLNFLVSDA
jgi:hypothetical protein